jgi:tetratricopeptide (TPR) repeat protein
LGASPPSSPAETTPGVHLQRGAAPRTPGPEFRIRGDVIGRYVVLDKLGSGGMGIVYAAYDPELDRKIALKLLRPGASQRAEVARARLLREAQALAKLNHPGVIAVHDVGMIDDQVFIAMEFVDGVDAAHWSKLVKRSWREVLPVWRQAGEGIAAAHAANVVHRDLKPENVLIGNDGRVRVLDFGLARTEASDPTVDRNAEVDLSERLGTSTMGLATSVRLTQAGAVVGTPAYMAPEQHTGGNIDARTDQFSYCVALYEALWGERPFAGERAPEIAFNVVRGRIREPSRDGPAVPAWLRKVVLRGLATNPDERWPDMRALLAALAADPAARQRRWALAGLGVTALGAAALLLSTLRPDEAACRGAERKLDGVWDDGVREQMRNAFAKSTRPYAADAFESTASMLDGHTGAFVRLHTDACEATAIRKEQSQDMLDRQVACLERRLKDVRALTQLLVVADDEAVTRAVTATADLPSFEPCGDREALMSPGAPPTGELAAKLAKIDDQLAAGRQEVKLARYEAALETARAALEAARQTEDLPTIAEALMLSGSARFNTGDGVGAERAFHEAEWAADEGKDDRARAAATTRLVFVLSTQPERAAEVADLAASTTAVLRRNGGDPLLEAELHNNVGVAARRRGDTTVAIAEHEAALALRRRNLAPDDPALADTLLNLGGSLSDAGRLDEAERMLEEAEQIVRKRYGSRHPRVATALHHHGLVSYRRRDYGTAVELLRQATEIRAAALPKSHPDLSGSRHDLGEALMRAGMYADALVEFGEAVALRGAPASPSGPGKPGSASTANTPNPGLANSLRGRGLAELAVGQLAEAEATLRRAYELRRASAEPLVLAEYEFAYARALVHGDPTAATALARKARAVYVAARKVEPVAEIDAWLAGVDRQGASTP